MLRVALGQLNTTVGDLDGNAERMLTWIGRAEEAGADLVCFPELALTGYPPEDLLLREEHPAIAASIAATTARMEADDVLRDTWPVDQARDDLQRLIGSLVRHRQKGADLVWEAYNVDIGGPE